ncbi:SAM-dependent methyltransferase [Nocardia beijingensis]|uniref:SAM-dependent methyltransferase n=1 Tax=Nocardia beijingensis TaxID=95162 RepID=UPI00189574A6|nr:SAM-dependent methyltransferase [Nocardia beijingensis]MBF6469808.1 SAM-dependent methyltransferase [Nocardia beijingensis]
MPNGQARARAGVSSKLDTSLAHEARVYDYWLGGKDNYPADRALGDTVAMHIPAIRDMARANRAFLGRAVRHLARDAGIAQFLDIGTGLPTAGNTHEVAQRIDPAARVLYVDNDPLVLAHARALMASTPPGRIDFLDADLRDPHAILDAPALAETFDPDRPIAILLVAVMMFFDDSEDPLGVVGRLLDAAPSGSYLVLTHFTEDFDARATARAVAAARQAGIAFRPRSRAETESFFTGTQLVEPGVVPVDAWRPDTDAAPAQERSAWYWAGVGRKP